MQVCEGEYCEPMGAGYGNWAVIIRAVINWPVINRAVVIRAVINLGVYKLGRL